MTIPAHITNAIRDGKMTYCGEAQLSNFGETARKGQYVEFFLDDGPDGNSANPFKGQKTGREKGQRFGLIAVPLGDDDAVASPTERKHWGEMRPSQQAGIRCSDPGFQAWLVSRVPNSELLTGRSGMSGAERAACDLRFLLKILSRKELDSDPAKKAAWDALDARFTEETRMATRHG